MVVVVVVVVVVAVVVVVVVEEEEEDSAYNVALVFVCAFPVCCFLSKTYISFAEVVRVRIIDGCLSDIGPAQAAAVNCNAVLKKLFTTFTSRVIVSRAVCTFKHGDVVCFVS